MHARRGIYRSLQCAVQYIPRDRRLQDTADGGDDSMRGQYLRRSVPCGQDEHGQRRSGYRDGGGAGSERRGMSAGAQRQRAAVQFQHIHDRISQKGDKQDHADRRTAGAAGLSGQRLVPRSHGDSQQPGRGRQRGSRSSRQDKRICHALSVGDVSGGFGIYGAELRCGAV